MKKVIILMTLLLFGGLSLPGTAPAIPILDSLLMGSAANGFFTYLDSSAFNDDLNFITRNFFWNKDMGQTKGFVFNNYKKPGLRRFVSQDFAEWKSLWRFPRNMPWLASVFYPGNVNNPNNAEAANIESFLNEPDGWVDSIFDSTTPVPEPATLFLLGSGMILFAVHSRRKLKQNE